MDCRQRHICVNFRRKHVNRLRYADFLLSFGKYVRLTIKIQTGVKPVSIFGFAHRIYGAGARLHDAFPLLKEEAFPAEEESKGMSAFLAEYGLDLSSLEEVDGGGPTGGSHVPSAGEAASSQELDSLGGVDGHGATGGSHAGLGAYVPLLHQEPGQHGST